MFGIFKLPRKFGGSEPGLLDPKDWNTMVESIAALKKEIEQLRPASGPDIGFRQSAGGFVAFLKRRGGGGGGGSGASNGPFCKKYKSDGSHFLLGGTASGGSGNITVPDITLGTVGSEPADGIHHWLQITFEAYVEDDVLLPGGDVTAATPGSGVSLPDNVMPTLDEPTGTLYVSLGSWSQGAFQPSACGNIYVSHCLGSLTHTRV
jgi:hypothetical protein